MSAIRVCRNGVWLWERVDNGAVGRVSHTRYGVKGGGPPIVVGAFVTGVSNRIGHEDGRRGKGPKP